MSKRYIESKRNKNKTCIEPTTTAQSLTEKQNPKRENKNRRKIAHH